MLNLLTFELMMELGGCFCTSPCGPSGVLGKKKLACAVFCAGMQRSLPDARGYVGCVFVCLLRFLFTVGILAKPIHVEANSNLPRGIKRQKVKKHAKVKKARKQLVSYAK